MSKSLTTRADLDSGTCDAPGCDCGKSEPFFIHSQCHQHAPMWPRYAEGELELLCSECGAVAVRIAVAG